LCDFSDRIPPPVAAAQHSFLLPSAKGRLHFLHIFKQERYMTLARPLHLVMIGAAFIFVVAVVVGAV
jgi:hypothetical protein